MAANIEGCTCMEKNRYQLLFEPRQNQQNECATSEDSAQPGHPPSVIRVFAVCSMGS